MNFFHFHRLWIAAGFVVLTAAFVKLSASSAQEIPLQLLHQCTNAIRAEQNVKSLRLNEELIRAAYDKLLDMRQYRYWAHQSPETKKMPWEFMDEAGYYYRTAGENLAIGYTLGEEICDAWKKSKTHYDNLIHPQFEEVGFAMDEVDLGGKRKGFLVVQMLGSRKRVVQIDAARAAEWSCDNAVDESTIVVQPLCGVSGSGDHSIVVYNPEGHDLLLRVDREPVKTSLLESGDFFRYTFDQPLSPGPHSITVQKGDDRLQRANLDLVVQELSGESIEELDLRVEFSRFLKDVAEYDVHVQDFSGADLQKFELEVLEASPEGFRKLDRYAFQRLNDDSWFSKIQIPVTALKRPANFLLKTKTVDFLGNASERLQPLERPSAIAQYSSAYFVFTSGPAIWYLGLVVLAILAVLVSLKKARRP